jgi:hypothetical protein
LGLSSCGCGGLKGWWGFRCGFCFGFLWVSVSFSIFLVFLLYTPCVLRGTSRFVFLIFHLLKKKKKKKKQFSWQLTLDDLSFESIGEVEANWLERAFEESEVFEVVKALNSDKALGPDGYSMAFFQACWDVLKEDIMNVFHDFHTRGKFERSLNGYVWQGVGLEFEW